MSLDHIIYKDEEKIAELLKKDSLILTPNRTSNIMIILFFLGLMLFALVIAVIPAFSQPEPNYKNIVMAVLGTSYLGLLAGLMAARLLPGRGVIHINQDLVEIRNILKNNAYKWQDIEEFKVEELLIARVIKIALKQNKSKYTLFTGYKYHGLHEYELSKLLNLWKNKHYEVNIWV